VHPQSACTTSWNLASREMCKIKSSPPVGALANNSTRSHFVYSHT